MFQSPPPAAPTRIGDCFRERYSLTRLSSPNVSRTARKRSFRRSAARRPITSNDAERRRRDRHFLLERVAAQNGRCIHPAKRSRAERVVQRSAASAILRSKATPRSSPPGSPTLTGAEAQLSAGARRRELLGGATRDARRRLCPRRDRSIPPPDDRPGRHRRASLQPSVMLANSGNAFTSEELRDLATRGAIGDIWLRFFDQEGRPVHGPLDERVIGMTLRRVEGTPRASPSPAATQSRGDPRRLLAARQHAHHRQVHRGKTGLSGPDPSRGECPCLALKEKPSSLPGASRGIGAALARRFAREGAASLVSQRGGLRGVAADIAPRAERPSRILRT